MSLVANDNERSVLSQWIRGKEVDFGTLVQSTEGKGQ